MADPKRLLILKSITDLLKTISVANGYRTDLGGNVVRGRVAISDTEPVPMVSIIEAPVVENRDEFAGNGFAVHVKWRLMVQGWVKDDPANPTDPVYPLLYDVRRCLLQMVDRDNPSRYLLVQPDGTRLIQTADVGFGMVRPPTPNISARAFFYLLVDIDMAESADDV